MKAIILAAGRGSRMGSLTENLPKCRSILHGKTLIDWQMDALQKAGITDIAIVRGYLADSFHFDLPYFENRRWAETNMVASLACAEDWLKTETCIVGYSDIVYLPDTVSRLMNCDGNIAITYDPNWSALWNLRFSNPLSDAETFRLDGDRVVEIGNRAALIEEIEGQYMGLLKFTPPGWKQVANHLTTLDQSTHDAMSMTKLLSELIASGIAVTAVASPEPWYEVDSEKDLRLYNRMKMWNPTSLTGKFDVESI